MIKGLHTGATPRGAMKSFDAQWATLPACMPERLQKVGLSSAAKVAAMLDEEEAIDDGMCLLEQLDLPVTVVNVTKFGGYICSAHAGEDQVTDSQSRRHHSRIRHHHPSMTTVVEIAGRNSRRSQPRSPTRR